MRQKVSCGCSLFTQNMSFAEISGENKHLGTTELLPGESQGFRYVLISE